MPARGRPFNRTGRTPDILPVPPLPARHPSSAATVAEVDDGHLDDVDRRLLAELVADGRVSVNELARRANVSRATAYARFDRLVASGVIRGFRADVDPEALGYGIAAMVLVNVEQGEWPTFREQLAAVPGIEYVALTSGQFDFVAFVRVPDIRALRDVVLHRLQAMRQVRATQTIFVLDEERHDLPVRFDPGGPARPSGPSGARRSRRT
jgi:DNA-binding Lrp family transcriptional regulator